jgi:hypothetical protein
MPVRIFNYSSAFAPEGKTVLQVMIESAWDPWCALREDMQAYRAEKKEVEQQVLTSLQKIWPGRTI